MANKFIHKYLQKIKDGIDMNPKSVYNKGNNNEEEVMDGIDSYFETMFYSQGE